MYFGAIVRPTHLNLATCTDDGAEYVSATPAVSNGVSVSVLSAAAPSELTFCVFIVMTPCTLVVMVCTYCVTGPTGSSPQPQLFAVMAAVPDE